MDPQTATRKRSSYVTRCGSSCTQRGSARTHTCNTRAHACTHIYTNTHTQGARGAADNERERTSTCGRESVRKKVWERRGQGGEINRSLHERGLIIPSAASQRVWPTSRVTCARACMCAYLCVCVRMHLRHVWARDHLPTPSVMASSDHDSLSTCMVCVCARASERERERGRERETHRKRQLRGSDPEH